MIDQIMQYQTAIHGADFDSLTRTFPIDHFIRLHDDQFQFYRTTFWYELNKQAANVFEATIQSLTGLAKPGQRVTGAEWWFSVLKTDATPQWLLPCHFDRNDLREKNHKKIWHPDKSSVLFLNTVKYSELVVTDQVLKKRGPRPSQPGAMQFIAPEQNKYVVFPGQLYHGVIGRMWRPAEPAELRVSMAVNWWTEMPEASYLRVGEDPLDVFSLKTR